MIENKKIKMVQYMYQVGEDYKYTYPITVYYEDDIILVFDNESDVDDYTMSSLHEIQNNRYLSIDSDLCDDYGMECVFVLNMKYAFGRIVSEDYDIDSSYDECAIHIYSTDTHHYGFDFDYYDLFSFEKQTSYIDYSETNIDYIYGL